MCIKLNYLPNGNVYTILKGCFFLLMNNILLIKRINTSTPEKKNNKILFKIFTINQKYKISTC